MKKIVIIGLLILALGTTAIIFASELPGGGWTSGTQVQNTGSSNATVLMETYDMGGTSFACNPQTLAPGKSYTFLPDSDCPLMPTGFEGSAVISSDGPIAAVTNVNNKPTGAAAGQYVGTSAADAAQTIAFPLVKSDHFGRTTTFYVQNASSTPNDMTATFIVQGTAYAKDYDNVPANAMVIVSPSDAGVPAGGGNVGGLTVVGTGPLAGASLEHETTQVVANNLQGSRAFAPSDYGDEIFCPLMRYNFGDKVTTTGLQVQNVSGGSETINVQYTVVAGPSGAGTVIDATSQTVPDGASANFLQANDLQSGDLAAGTITSSGGGDLAAIVNDKATGTSPERVTTYACFSAANATATISLPLVKEAFYFNTTGVQVQNIGTNPTNVELSYSTNTGATVVIRTSSPLAVGASKTFYSLASGGTSGITVVSGSLSDLNNTVNGVIATGSEPIVAIANESSLSANPNPQDTKNYEGFNLP